MDYIIPNFVAAAFQKKHAQGLDGPKNKAVNPLTYPKSAAPFSSELFKNPTSEYRGCPLWSWNTKLNEAQLLRQIDYLSEMGMGGFHVGKSIACKLSKANVTYRYMYGQGWILSTWARNSWI